MLNLLDRILNSAGYLIRTLYASVNNRGVVQTLKIIANEFWFDFRYDIESRRAVHLADLSIDNENKIHGREYASSAAIVLREIFNRLDLDEYLSGIFVDIGCGKGKALIIAAEQGFERIVGVDFSSELCQICQENIRRYRARTKNRAVIQIINQDAASLDFPADARVFYFNNPFDAYMFRKVKDKIKESIIVHPRTCLVIYYAPIHQYVFDSDNFFEPDYRDVNVACFRINPHF